MAKNKSLEQIRARNIKRREWVNSEASKKMKGKSLTLSQRTKMFDSLWKQAKKKYK